jgi:diguanylate cyclase (GGDEF)-like protein
MLSESRRGRHFFESCKREALVYIHPDDSAAFLEAMDRENLVKALNRNSTFMMTYRLMGQTGLIYVSMKVSRMEDDERIVVIGVTDVDEQMKRRKAAERVKEERIAYERISALTGDFLSVYIVMPDSGRYRQYSPSKKFSQLSMPKDGMEFFDDARDAAGHVLHPEDVDRFLATFTRENVLSKVQQTGFFSLSYRRLFDGKPIFVQLKAAMVQEKEGARLIVGINDIDAQVRQEEDYEKRLAQAQRAASIDALTGVKNKHAYLAAEEQLNRQIQEHVHPEFAVVILDVNDLKKVNDTEGHKAGDQYLRSACRIVCTTFKHSPVFRVGGDEFAVISQGSDYQHIEELVGMIADHNSNALQEGGIVIACGMAKMDGDACVAKVFERADEVMYENKSLLKAAKQRNV